MSQSGISPRAAPALFFFFAIFAGVGLFFVVIAVRHLLQWSEMQSWIETPATILEAKVVRKDSDSTPRATAKYRYEFDGQQFTGDRVAISRSSDGIGKFHRRVVAELRETKARVKPFPAFVDPDDPSRAVLYRNLRPELLFFFLGMGFLFGLVAGWPMMLNSALAWRRARGERQRKQQFPDAPWRWPADWNAGRIASFNKGGLTILAGVAFVWNLLVWPSALAALPEVVEGNLWVQITIATFLLVGIVLAGCVLRSFIHWWKFGFSTLVLETPTGVTGGLLQGTIRIPRRLPKQHTFRLVLECVKHSQHKDKSGDTDTRTNVLWQAEQIVIPPDTDIASSSIVPFQFAIPYTARVSHETDNDNKLVWQLRASSNSPGLAYTAKFDVPVFRTSESRADFQVDNTNQVAAPVIRSSAQVLKDAGLRVEVAAGGGRRIVFPLGRHIGSALGVTTIFAVLAAGLIFWWNVLPSVKESAFNILPNVAIIGGCGLISALLLWVSLDGWLARNVITIQGSQLKLHGGWLGFGRVRRLQLDQVNNLKRKNTMSSGSAEWYDILLVTSDKKIYTIGKRIRDRATADNVVEEITAIILGEERV